MKLLILGATGLVGRHVLAKALAHPRIESVIAPARRATVSHPKLVNPIVNFDHLPEQESGWKADAVICTLGTTIKIAGSQKAFYRVDHDYVLAAARLARKQKTPVFVLVSAIGANVESRFFYNRVKGEVERDIASLGFRSLTFVRPGLIGGKRDTLRPMETALGFFKVLLDPFLPKRYRTNPAERIAEKVLESAINGEAGQHIVTSDKLV